MDFLVQLLFEVYLNIGEILVPEDKLKGWQCTLLKVLCVVVCCCILGLLGVGIAFLVEGGELVTMGIIFTSVGSVLLAAQLGLTVFVIVRELKKEKAKKQ